MIKDSFSNLENYFKGSETWSKICKFITGLSPEAEPKKYLIEDEDIFASIAEYETKLEEDGVLEAHRKYIDIQFLLSGKEKVYVFNVKNLESDIAFDENRDVEFFKKNATKEKCITLVPKNFLLLYPEDAHMPCISSGDSQESVKKVVVKIRQDLLPGYNKRGKMKKVVLTGSSIFEQWYNFHMAFPGCNAVNRAIGGTQTPDWLEKGMLPVLKEERPDYICMYCGSNDMWEISEEITIANIKRSRQIIEEFNPKIRFAYYGIIKAPGKRLIWDKVERVNKAIMEYLGCGDMYYEFNDIFFNNGKLIEELFLEDQTHHPHTAYDKLVDAVTPVMTKWLNHQ